MALARESALRIVDAGSPGLDLAGLVPAIAAGDELASSRFYEATSGLLFGLLLLILGDTSTAEIVLSEVYAEVKQYAARYDKNRESLLTWLVTIAHRRALEHLCSSSGDQQFAVAVGLAGGGSGPAHLFGISKSAHRKLVSATLEVLSPAERKMLELAYFSRLTPRAIAARLQQTPEAVTAGLQFGISQLYRLFKNQGLLREV